MAFDISKARERFPALQQDQVFLDNAGGSQTLDEVINSYVKGDIALPFGVFMTLPQNHAVSVQDQCSAWCLVPHRIHLKHQVRTRLPSGR